MIVGLDISDNQGLFNWNNVDRRFGIVKATQGITDQDVQFRANWAALKKKRMLRGAYHFMDTSDAAAQAVYFVNFVKDFGLGKKDILCLDMEDRAISNRSIRIFVNEVQHLTGKRLVLYTEYSIMQDGYFDGLTGNPLWIANPEGIPGHPPDVSPFPTWAIQQYSWKPLDEDIFNGITHHWKEMANLTQPAELVKVYTDGTQSLSQIAVEAETAPSTILRVTLNQTAEHRFGPHQAAYINDVFNGLLSPTAPIPAGVTLYYRKRAT